jgi:MoxR-like ATPase
MTIDKVRALRAGLEASFAERESEIEGLLVAALAGENVVMVGPPGTAKSAIARAFTGAVGGRYFEQLLTRFSTPEELFGPFRLTALQQDRFTRNSAGKLPDVEVAFLDEVFKAGAGLLNALLPALNERVFHDDGVVHSMPLRLVVGASNEYPQGEELAALWDRFLVRFDVSPLREQSARRKLVTNALLPAPRDVLTLEEWDAARAAVAAVTIDDACADKLLELVDKARATGAQISDRRTVKLANLLRAAAYLDGATAADPENFPALSHALWDKPEQRAPISAIVAQSVSPELAEATKRYDDVTSAVAPMIAKGGPDASRALAEIERAGKALKEQYKKARKGSRASTKIREMVERLAKLHQETVAKASKAWDASDLDSDDVGF